jgi:hypothetical protein
MGAWEEQTEKVETVETVDFVQVSITIGDDSIQVEGPIETVTELVNQFYDVVQPL